MQVFSQPIHVLAAVAVCSNVTVGNRMRMSIEEGTHFQRRLTRGDSSFA